MRVFLDTNILLDVLLDRPQFVADSEADILHCEKSGAEMFVAWHGLATGQTNLPQCLPCPSAAPQFVE